LKFAAIAAIVLNLLASCGAGPLDTAPPNAAIPERYRDQRVAEAMSFADVGWWETFKDPVLVTLLRRTVENNYDARIAAERLYQAEQQYVTVNANRYPNLTFSIAAPLSATAGAKPATIANHTFVPQGLFNAAYQVDLFGQLRSASDAARAQILATEDAREAVVVTIVSAVASQYFSLRELDQELAIAQLTVAGREKQLKLNVLRNEGGVGTLQDVSQAEQLLATARAAVPAIEQSIEQTENLISTLTGGYPAPVARGLPLEDQIAMPGVPQAGIPSQILERRPDIRLAEQNLVAARAQLGVARALLYPQINIGGAAGVGATDINGKFYGPEGLFSLVPSLLQPIFNAGSLNANVKLNQSIERQRVLEYLESVQTGFREVSDSLIAYDKQREVTAQALATQTATETSTRLADMRFRGGVTTYLEVLISEQNSFTAQLSYVRSELAERLALVQLYQALGGGWQPQPGSTAPTPLPG
jgi:multidrug efflux system outer membrane protein